jgi:hypothetical protein
VFAGMVYLYSKGVNKIAIPVTEIENE